MRSSIFLTLGVFPSLLFRHSFAFHPPIHLPTYAVRFEQYFGWWDDYNVLTNTTINYCHYKKISDGNHLGSTPAKDEDAAAIIAARNWADMELFMYAKHQLFPAQAALVA